MIFRFEAKAKGTSGTPDDDDDDDDSTMIHGESRGKILE
jgi:hypothetical protein